MATSGVLGWLNIRGLDCRITFPDEIYSDSPTLVTALVVQLKTLIPSYLLQVGILGEESIITSTAERNAARFSFTHTFRGRGYKECGYAVIRSPFPVNFFVRGVKIPLEGRAIVFPAPLSPNIEEPGQRTVESGMAALDTRGFDGDTVAISNYTGAEPIKMIHWRLSARHDWFKVKEPSATPAEPVMLDLTTPSTIPLEMRLSQATYLVNRLCRANRPVGLKLAADRLIPATSGRNHRLRLLTELALYDPPR